jgi:hypothetical protein
MTTAGFESAVPATVRPPGLKPGRFKPRERSGALSRPQGRSGQVQAISHSKEFEPRTFQHLASLIKRIHEQFVLLPHLIQTLLWNKIRISRPDLMKISYAISKDVSPDLTGA